MGIPSGPLSLVLRFGGFGDGEIVMYSEGGMRYIQDIGGFIHVRYDEMRRSLEANFAGSQLTSSRAQRTEIGVAWNYPPDGWYVLNTDGAAKGSPGPAGGGAIIRDHRGILISAIALKLGVCTSFRAEFLVLAKGLDHARQAAAKHWAPHDTNG